MGATDPSVFKVSIQESWLIYCSLKPPKFFVSLQPWGQSGVFLNSGIIRENPKESTSAQHPSPKPRDISHCNVADLNVPVLLIKNQLNPFFCKLRAQPHLPCPKSGQPLAHTDTC